MKPGPALTALLAHEYAHAVCFSRRFAADRGIGPLAAEEDWLNEAIAHVAENLHDAGWSNLDYRIAAYLTEPQRNPLVVADYYRAGLWRDPGCRGAAYLFLRWCLDHYGDALVRELVNNSATGCHNIEQVTGIAFEDLYRHWTIALWNGAFTSINLRDRLGDCRLSGPAMRRWNPECEDCRLELRGMATAFVEVCNLPNEAPRRLKIQASPGARLQVTVIPDR
jgi:hypothetical protein